MGLPSLKQNRNSRIVFILTKMSMHTIRKLTFWKVCFLVKEYSSLPLIHGQDGRQVPGHWDPSETLKNSAPCFAHIPENAELLQQIHYLNRGMALYWGWLAAP